jgi:hypothetical protein
MAEVAVKDRGSATGPMALQEIGYALVERLRTRIRRERDIVRRTMVQGLHPIFAVALNLFTVMVYEVFAEAAPAPPLTAAARITACIDDLRQATLALQELANDAETRRQPMARPALQAVGPLKEIIAALETARDTPPGAGSGRSTWI